MEKAKTNFKLNRLTKNLLYWFAIVLLLSGAVWQFLNMGGDSAKGIIEEVKLIEVTIDKINFSKLRLSNVDPSDALEIFKPKMKFSRSSGFKTLE